VGRAGVDRRSPSSEGADNILTAVLADDTGTFTRDSQPLPW
jgi:hypothetical protein